MSEAVRLASPAIVSFSKSSSPQCPQDLPTFWPGTILFSKLNKICFSFCIADKSDHATEKLRSDFGYCEIPYCGIGQTGIAIL